MTIDNDWLATETQPVADDTPPWLVDVRGDQVKPLITGDAGTLRVQAGPGTGKTFGLRRRVLRLLHPLGDGVDPEKVLVCSFNRVIANDLREEITKELAAYGLGIPRVTTVHSLCAWIVGAAPRFLLPHEVEVMTYDVLAAHPKLRLLYKTQPKAYRALREHEAGLTSHTALAQAVNEWLADHHGSLVGAVVRQVHSGLDAGDFESGVFEHVIVDEFQDLSSSEAQILVNLCAEGGQLVALGDRKQSIYSFRGNDKRGLDALPDLVADDVQDMPMDECQRCFAEVVQLANAVMALEGEPLVPVRGAGAEIHHVHYKTPSSETKGIAAEIARVFNADPEADHLVLVTRRTWGYDLRNAIRDVDPGVPVETSFAEDVLETWPAREAFMLLEAVGDPDAIALRDWIAYKTPKDGKDFKASERNAPAYLSLKTDHGTLTAELASKLKDAPLSSFHGAGKGDVRRRLKRLGDLLDDVPSADDPGAVVAHVFDPDRWIDFTGEHADLAREDLLRLRVESEAILEDMDKASLKQLVHQLRYRIATREPLGAKHDGGVRIVTLWGAKGLTADYVYVVGLCDEALPGPHDPVSTGQSPAEHLAEQRRLLYVSLTRAKKALVVSRAKKIKSGDARRLGLSFDETAGHWQTLHRTQFLDALPSGALPKAVDGGAWSGIHLSDD